VLYVFYGNVSTFPMCCSTSNTELFFENIYLAISMTFWEAEINAWTYCPLRVKVTYFWVIDLLLAYPTT
jgi:hypothetical protein